MLRLHDIRARTTRLEELGRGLALEAARLREGKDPLLYRERCAYRKALGEARAGAELARVTLAGRRGQADGGAVSSESSWSMVAGA